MKQLLNGKTTSFEPPYTHDDMVALHDKWNTATIEKGVMGHRIGATTNAEYEVLRTTYKGTALMLIARAYPFYYGYVTVLLDIDGKYDYSREIGGFCLPEDYHKEEIEQRGKLQGMDLINVLTQ